MGNNLNSSFDALFGKMENFITSKTVIGEPINIGDVIVIPLVDISFGVGAGAYEGTNEKDLKSTKESGGGGLGAKISPSAVLVIINGQAQLMSTKNQDGISKLIDMAPGILNKLNFSSMFNKNKDSKESSNDNSEKSEVKFAETKYYESGDTVSVETTVKEI